MFWKQHPSLPLHVSSNGDIATTRNYEANPTDPKTIAPFLNKNRGKRYYVNIPVYASPTGKRTSMPVHSLVAETYLTQEYNKKTPIKNTVIFKDHDSTNFKPGNLQYVTRKQACAYITDAYNNLRKPVDVYFQNDYLYTAESISDAAERTHLTPQRISDILRGRRLSARGYLFVYHSEEE